MSWRKFFSAYNNSGLPLGLQQNDAMASMIRNNRYSNWLPEVYTGSPNRLIRYQQYDQMDRDLEVNAALDTIAEFATQKDEFSGIPFVIEYLEKSPSDSESDIIQESLKEWCLLNDMDKRAYRIFRDVCKYGDQFFIRDPETLKMLWIDPANIEKIVINYAEGKRIEAYFVKDIEANFAKMIATKVSALHNRPYGSGQGLTGMFHPVATQISNYAVNPSDGTNQGQPVGAEDIVHISLTEGMDHEWPFGNSILNSIFKVFKQKELLEDSIIIYRVHRAPERRVFFIDVGNLPPHKTRQYLEQLKYEVQQQRVPNKRADGTNVLDAAYNPMSMLEDYYFPQTGEGRGSKVETLPGGENLNQIDDLKYFNNKLLRGLKIPSSYLPTGPDDGTAQNSDGKLGIAYIQEHRFAKYIERLQGPIAEVLDGEFKKYLVARGVPGLDNNSFRINFVPPMNFSSYKELAMDNERSILFSQMVQVPFISNQFALRRFMGLSEEEIKTNEKMWRMENDYEKFNKDDEKMELGDIGVRPMSDQEVGDELSREEQDNLENDTDISSEISGAPTDSPEAPALGPTDGGLL